MRKKKKRGISEIISWVLMIGFAVTLAVMVTQWSIKHSEKQTKGIVKMVSGETKCQDIQIAAKIYCGTEVKVNITNTGGLNIDQLSFNIIYTSDKRGKGEHTNLIGPGVTITKTFNDLESIRIVPVLEIEEELYGCNDRVVDLSC